MFALIEKTAFAKQKISFIILGPGGRVDQEYNDYAKELNKKGYKINIHSFDSYYSDSSYSQDREMTVKIKECTPEFDECQILEQGLDNEALININYVIYNDASKSFMFVKRENPKNSVNLFRYASNVSTNNINGQYIQKLVKKAIKNKEKVVFIDAVWCGGLQPLTVKLFSEYKNKAIFIHAVHNKVEIIDDNLITLNNDKNCANGNTWNYEYRCVNKIRQITADFFNESQKMHKLLRKYNKFEDMPIKLQKDFFKFATAREEARSKFWDSESCINDKLHASKFDNIDSKVITEYTQSLS